MIKTFRKIAFATILIFPLVFISCLNTDDAPERTAATEQQELDEVIGNLVEKGYNVDTTATGMYYIIDTVGSGEYPQSGDTCDLIYTGFFLDGTIFDASYFHYEDSIWTMVYKEVDLIPGFDEAIGLLKKGGKGDFIIPSDLAYGASGSTRIPPYSPLGFALKIRDIRPKN